MLNINLSKLLKAGVHLGHESKRWNPKMLPYIYTKINDIHLLDVTQSANSLKKANIYVQAAANQKKNFLFIGTDPIFSDLIAQEAKRCNSDYVNSHWVGGMLTNWKMLQENIKTLNNLEQEETNNTFKLLSKKEIFLRKKKLKKLHQRLDGIKTMPNLPDIAIIIGQKQEMTAIHECQNLNIPIVSMLDTNCNPDLIDVVIPGNDDTTKSVELILKSLTESIILGKS